MDFDPKRIWNGFVNRNLCTRPESAMYLRLTEIYVISFLDYLCDFNELDVYLHRWPGSWIEGCVILTDTNIDWTLLWTRTNPLDNPWFIWMCSLWLWINFLYSEKFSDLYLDLLSQLNDVGLIFGATLLGEIVLIIN